MPGPVIRKQEERMPEVNDQGAEVEGAGHVISEQAERIPGAGDQGAGGEYARSR